MEFRGVLVRSAGTVAEYKRLTLVEMGIKCAVPAYGLTETYGNATVGSPDDPLEVKLATSGTPLPGMEMRIVDPATGRDLPAGEVGLVLIRGHTTTGYLNNPRSEEHTSELQSLMRISYAVFCLKKKKNKVTTTSKTTSD